MTGPKSRPRRRDTEERLKQEIERLRRELAEREREVAEQAKRIKDLEHELALHQQNSTTTSKPPSSDGLAGQQRMRGRRQKSRRPRGAQPGHPGHCRPLVSLDRVNVTVDVQPTACRQCAHVLHARDERGDPRRHQVTELPPIEAHITEYRCHRRVCAACGATTLAALPDEGVGQFGPQLTALIAYLTMVCRMPRLVVQRFLEGVLQIPISLGSTQAAWEEASAAVGAPYAELEAALPQEPVVNADETGHRTNGAKRWLWVFVAHTFVFYRIAASRGSEVLRAVLGETFTGVLGSDRLPSYLKCVAEQRQLCWAHLTRNLLSALDLATTPSAKRFCREALVLTRRLFRLWHRYRGDPTIRGAPLTRPELIAKALPIEKAFFRLGERYLDAASADVRNLAYALFVHNQHFFTFVHKPGVAPTNNVSERALRTAVQWRKISFGTRSEEGERAVERLADHRAHVSTAGTQCPRLPDRGHRRVPPPSPSRVLATQAADPLNCYS
ncbi:MAG TPA: IS66 family transposase [Vicinamibacterales bacterium]|nr:IS66 family transposase [Vicinamibacterales bacterium]